MFDSVAEPFLYFFSYFVHAFLSLSLIPSDVLVLAQAASLHLVLQISILRLLRILVLAVFIPTRNPSR